MKTKIILAGGTGDLGSSLIKYFNNSSFDLVILSRTIRPTYRNIRFVQWDGKTVGEWKEELENSQAVINLVGRSVNCRYNEANKNEIFASRVNSTIAIGKAIQLCKTPPKTWINVGSAAIFGDSMEIKNELSSIGEGFSVEVCKAWEKTFFSLPTPHTRKVFLRTGIVLQPNGGVLKTLNRLVKFGLGGTIGEGNQFITWIHEEDFARIIEWVMNSNDISGIINCTSPNPISNKEFMKELRKSLGMAFGLPSPSFLVRIGAILISTESELVLTGRRVIPQAMREKGYAFKYPLIKDALQATFKDKLKVKTQK